MPLARKQPAIRRAVAQAANGCCEYCRVPESRSPAPFQIEHIIPLANQGKDTLENLAYSCGGCNGHKLIATHANDPATGKSVALFHPRKDWWEEHFAWSQKDITVVQGLTPTGRATIARLQLNRAGLVGLRRILTLAGEHPPSTS